MDLHEIQKFRFVSNYLHSVLTREVQICVEWSRSFHRVFFFLSASPRWKMLSAL
jgi:hypothetical protein